MNIAVQVTLPYRWTSRRCPLLRVPCCRLWSLKTHRQRHAAWRCACVYVCMCVCARARARCACKCVRANVCARACAHVSRCLVLFISTYKSERSLWPLKVVAATRGGDVSVRLPVCLSVLLCLTHIYIPKQVSDEWTGDLVQIRGDGCAAAPVASLMFGSFA